MLVDMQYEAQLAGGEALESVFFGGGTPSLMPPALVSALLDEAERLWGFAADIEITLEANPSSVEAANFAALAAADVNRVSLGVQSLNDEVLRFLGRLHSADEALAALDVAQKHFQRVSFDLIYARPGQTAKDWETELARALSFDTGHLSLYQLTIEPGTRVETDVRLGKFTPQDDDEAADLYELTAQITSAVGLPAYEISNHARPGEESRHNLTYWRYQDYCGIGPGAHGRRNGVATTRHKKPENWLAAVDRIGSGCQLETSLGQSEQVAEALMMGLRLREGIDLAAMSARFVMDRANMMDQASLAELLSMGLMWHNEPRIGLTPRAFPLLDAILPRLISDQLVPT